jgi:hypothetical protein
MTLACAAACQTKRGNGGGSGSGVSLKMISYEVSKLQAIIRS